MIVTRLARPTVLSTARPATALLQSHRHCSSAPAPAPAAAAPAPAPAPAPAAPAAPASSSDSGGGTEKSLHSSDIAFKPTTDGWGYSDTYAKGWDNIFAKKKKPEPAPAPTSAAAAAEPATDPALAPKMQALQHALDAGALSPALYEQARAELEKAK